LALENFSFLLFSFLLFSLFFYIPFSHTDTHSLRYTHLRLFNSLSALKITPVAGTNHDPYFLICFPTTARYTTG
jgi:hypothetical protein